MLYVVYCVLYIVCCMLSRDMEKHPIVFPIWSKLIVRLLQSYLYRHKDVLVKSGVSFSQVLRCHSLEDLDALLISAYGYTSLSEYYRDNSPVHWAEGVVIPTLSISSEDDPICSASAHPSIEQGNLGKGLCIVRTATGGHCSFPQGYLPLKTSWTDAVIMDWIDAHP